VSTHMSSSSSQFTASSQGLVCSRLALPFNVDGPSTVEWSWSSADPVEFTVTFLPLPGQRYSLGEHVGTAWTDRAVPIAMAQPADPDQPQPEPEPLVLTSMSGSDDKGIAEVEGSGEVTISWHCPASSSMLSGLFGSADPDTEIKYALTVGATAAVHARVEDERRRAAAEKAAREAKVAALRAEAAACEKDAAASAEDVKLHQAGIDELAPKLDQVEAAFAEQQDRVEKELAKLEEMHAPLEELKAKLSVLETSRNEAETLRREHLDSKQRLIDDLQRLATAPLTPVRAAP